MTECLGFKKKKKASKKMLSVIVYKCTSNLTSVYLLDTYFLGD